MIFCEHCFKDKEISAIICGLPESKIGDCTVCNHKGVNLYDTDIQNELTPYFEELINIYTPASILRDGYGEAEKFTLVGDMKKRWNMFADGISDEKICEILKSICSESYENANEIFDGKIGILELKDKAYMKEHALLKDNSWEAFTEEIRTKNRYHSKLVNLDILEKYCSFIRKVYKKGETFYRARISGEVGYPACQMSAPPADKSSEGRANARGITCLYMASDTDTALHEVRAGVFDFVSVGTFELKQDITVANLRAISEISPFIGELEYLDHAINKEYLERLNIEMSKPLRRSDSTLDYIPTQYIVDFIKSIERNGEYEYDGIEYNSTTNLGGFNLAVFNPDLLECVEVKVYDIEKLHYDIKEINVN